MPTPEARAGLVRDCGVDGDKLPEIVRCTDVLGRLTLAAAEDLGLAPETQVVAGAIDTTAAAVGAAPPTTSACTCTWARRPGSPRTCRSRRRTCSRASRPSPARSPAAGC